MSAARMGRKWADVDEDDEDGPTDSAKPGQGTSFETKPDKDGIKTVIEYVEKAGQTYKLTRKVKVTTLTRRTNEAMRARKTMNKFGKALTADERTEAAMIVKSVEEIPLELTKKTVTLAVKDDAEDIFFENSLNITEGLFKEKKVWSGNTAKLASAEAAAEIKKPEDVAAPVAAAAPAGDQAGKYLPPSLRGGKGDGKGGKDGKGMDQNQEASLRITNLSEDVREGDLQDLFGQVGRLQRVYLAKDMVTFQSRGFAFVTYYNREDAQRAIDKLNKHPYDNLILQVQFAKPKT